MFSLNMIKNKKIKKLKLKHRKEGDKKAILKFFEEKNWIIKNTFIQIRVIKIP
jgi:hypothetical protein